MIVDKPGNLASNNRYSQTMLQSGVAKHHLKNQRWSGQWFDDQEGISKLITSEFEKRFKSNITINPSRAIPLSKKITEVDNESVTREVSYEEILKAMKQINPMKVLRPNGMQSIFYHKKMEYNR